MTSNKLLIFSVFFFITAFACFSSETVLMEDRFDNNNNNWLIDTAKDRKFYLQNKRYIIESSLTPSFWASATPVGINERKDFSIEINAEKISGENDYGFGIFWGMKDLSNFYQFAIVGKGAFVVLKTEAGVQSMLVDYTSNAAINKFDNKNNLRIVKQKNRMLFYINNTEVAKIPYERFFGKFMGVSIYNNKKVAFDDLIIKELDTKQSTEPRTRIAVVEFSERGASGVKDAGIITAEWMANSIFQTDTFEVYDRLSLDRVIKEQKLQTADDIDEKTAIQLGKLTGVQAIVTGSLSFLNNKYILTVNLVNAETGKLIKSSSVEASSFNDLHGKMKNAAVELAD